MAKEIKARYVITSEWNFEEVCKFKSWSDLIKFMKKKYPIWVVDFNKGKTKGGSSYDLTIEKYDDYRE